MSSSVSCLELIHLPDDVLLHILSHLNPLDLWKISHVCTRFGSLVLDRSLVRNSSFDGLYNLTNDIFRQYVVTSSNHIEVLNCDHCYWLKGAVMDCVARCKNLKSLSVIDCQITPKRFCHIVSKLENLERLSFSVLAIRDFCNEYKQCPEVKKRFSKLKELVIHFKRGYRGVVDKFSIAISVAQQTTFLEDCECLEKLSIIGGTNSFPKDLLRPLLERVSSLKNLKEIGINNGADPAARLFFFGVLLLLCQLELRYETLLMPSANFAHLQKNTGFKDFFKNCENLRHLDVSRAEADLTSIDTAISPLSNSASLRYLNIADNYKMDCEQLKLLSLWCPNLISLNLQNCIHIINNTQSGQMDTCGIESLAEKCVNLRHLNLSGIHVHCLDAQQDIQTLCNLLTPLKELRSLALPACCLCTPETDDLMSRSSTQIGNKRVRVSYSAPKGFGKKRRVGVPVASTSAAVEAVGSPYDWHDDTSELDRLSSVTPNIEEFELIGVGFRSVFNKTHHISSFRQYITCNESHTVCDDELMSISKWRNLQSLQISGLPGVLHGKSLVSIAQGCKKLERLYLSCLGSRAHWSFQPALSQALSDMSHLRDFRLEQDNVSLNSFFFEGFYNCVSLERICVISRNSTLYSDHLETFIEKLKSLVAVQLFTGSSATQCKNIQTRLISRFSARPALSVHIVPLAVEELPNLVRTIPSKHYDELLLLSSEVAGKPEGW